MKITLLTGKTFDIKQALDMEIKIIKSPAAKRLTLRIDAKERIPVLTIPSRCAAQKAVNFVNEHREWIEDNLAKIPVARRFEDGETISILGQNCTICHTPQSRRGTYIEGDKLYVSGDIEFLHRRICDYIKKTARKEFLKLSRQMAKKIGCQVKNVAIKDTKSRWGSCSTLDNINYNWRIALAPEFVILYLIAHEVSHLRHQDHSKEFWQCVKNLFPDCGKGRLWLKQHGKDLYLYE